MPAVDDFAASGYGGLGKLNRVSGCGFQEEGNVQRAKQESFLPPGFLDPLPREHVLSPQPLSAVGPVTPRSPPTAAVASKVCRQFWKAGDYEGPAERPSPSSAGIDHVRVHPKFLHSNATSHKWALGALAELLDNSIDEVCNGATFVNIDVLENPRERSKMLLVEDNGGGMDQDKIRQCMSLGYSAKSKSDNTIGQYGNGFKTSTMRLGADVIVFSRFRGNDGMSSTQSIGMLSYTFLRDTGKQDIIVPMVDYEKRGDSWKKMERSSCVAWNTNLDLILQWSPYSKENDLLEQFKLMSDQGTRIIIYNLWEDDVGQLELDFAADVNDIQIRGASRDVKKIEMAKKFPYALHFLTYRHSLRSYASILYLKLPQGFKMILRGKEIEHHNIVNDMMMKQEITYRPQAASDGVSKDLNLLALVTIGFVKDAESHVDIQGFNLYHKNRLIKPFWRVWNAAGSDGRGVIGVLEANFVKPSHDKQGFERTTVLSRLEARLLHMQKSYWSSNCHKIGYAPRRNKKFLCSSEKESSPAPHTTPMKKRKNSTLPDDVESPDLTGDKNSGNLPLHSSDGTTKRESPLLNSDGFRNSTSVNLKEPKIYCPEKLGEYLPSKLMRDCLSISSSKQYGSGTQDMPASETISGYEEYGTFSFSTTLCDELLKKCSKKNSADSVVNASKSQFLRLEFQQLAKEHKTFKERINKLEHKLQHDLQAERKKNEALTEQVEELEKKLKEADKEQETLIDIFSEERQRRDAEEEKLREQLKAANGAIRKFLEKLASHGIKEDL